MRRQIGLKICSYVIASLATSDSRDILFYCLLCACVCMSVFVWLFSSSLCLSKHNKRCYVCFECLVKSM